MDRASRSTAGIRATLVRILAYMGGLAILAVVAASFFRTTTGIAALDPAPRPQWIEVERPHPAFELLMPELAASAFDYAIRRRVTDGARKDVLTWGDMTAAGAGAGPYVMVEIYRPGAENEPFIDAASEIAARIVAFTVTDDVKPADHITTKFGTVPLIDFAIAERGREHRCLGFARAFAEPTMQIAGWYCSAGREVVDRATLGCALDRLTLISAGGDPRLDALFARAELKRAFCGRRNPILAATPEREDRTLAAQTAGSPNVKLRGRLPPR